MKKKWMAVSCLAAFCLASGAAFWLEKPVLTEVLGNTVTENVNTKLNGTLSYASLDLSLSGRVVVKKPVIKDQAGRVVLEGDELQVLLSPGKLVSSLASGQTLGVLDTLKVEKPVLHVWQNEDGAWNVTTLLKQNSTDSDAGFRGSILVEDGTARVKLPDNTVVVGENVNGNVSLADYPAFAIDAAAEVDGKKLTAHGSYTSTRKYDFVFSGDSVKAVYASSFIPSSVDVLLQNGNVNHLKVRVADDHRGFFLSGSADVSDGKAKAYGVNVDNLQGHVELSTDNVRLSRVQGQANGQKFKLDGTIVTNGDTPVFDLLVDVPGADISAFQDFLPVTVSGTAGFQGKLWGTAQDISADGKLSVENLAYENYSLDKISAQLRYAKQQVEADDIDVQAFGGEATGKAVYNTQSGAYRAEAALNRMDLSKIPDLPVSVLGLVSGQLQAAGNGNDGTLQAQGSVQAEDLSYEGINIAKAAGDFSYDGHTAVLNNLHADIAGGSLDVSGSYDVDKQLPDFTFTAKKLPLDIASSFIAVPLSGTVDLAGHVSGSEPVWDVALSASDGEIKGMPFDHIDGSLNGKGNQVQIPSLNWTYKDGQHLIRGQADLDARTVNASVTTKHMRIERLLPAIGKSDLPLTGWADNTITISGSLDNPAAQGSFALTSGSYNGYLYRNVSADYRLENGTLYLSNGDISSYTASLSFGGSLGNNLNLDISGKQLDLARILPDNGVPHSGMFAVQAHIGGTLAAPTASGSLTAANLVINHQPIMDIHGDFSYGNNLLSLSNLHFAQLGGNYDGNLTYNVALDQLQGQAKVTNGDIAGLLKVADLPLQQIEGKLDGTLNLSGSSANPAVSMQGQITQGTLAGQAVEPADINLEMENGVVNVKQLAFKTGDSILAAQGKYALHGPVNLSLAAKQFPAKVLMAITGQNTVSVDGPINFVANLGGTGDDLKADVSAELENGTTINGVSITGAYALLNIRNGLITVQQASGSRDPYKVSAHGTIPVSALSGGRGAQSMDLTLQLDNAGLDVLTFLTPYVTSADGPIKGSVKVSGTLDAPRLDGEITIDNGSVTFKDTAYPLANIKADLAFKGTAATLSGSGTMDKKGKKDPGSVTLDGQAAWSGRELTNYQLAANFANLNINNPYYEGPLNGYVSITPGDGRPKISGLMEIANATLDVPLSFSDSSAMPDIETDFTLTLGDKVHLYNPALYDLWVGGSATFKGTLAHPQPSGRFEALRGSVHYLDTTFSVSKAKADFSRYDSFLPYIDAEGVSRVGQYSVLLTLRGPADNMDLMLRSDPPLTRQQIVSLITLRNGSGQPQSSISGEDVNQLLSSGIRMTLNSLGITQSLEHALSLDMLTVTSGSLDLSEKNMDVGKNYYNIEMGKYLTNDFMLTAAFGLNHDDDRFGMRYDLGSKFSADAWASDDNRFIGGVYKYTF